MQRLRITEIFYSLQGETKSIGIPTVFIRLTGCPLRCGYCDSSYAFEGGNYHTLDAIIDEVQRYRTTHVTVTGGEPLAQKPCIELLTRLADLGYEVSLETSGALSVEQVDPRVIKVLDLKTPGSGEEKRNLWQNLDYLLPHDQIKFVICDQNDYEWCKRVMTQHHLLDKCHVLFSPSYGQLAYDQLAQWILDDQIPVRMQLQMHKLIWGDQPGR